MGKTKKAAVKVVKNGKHKRKNESRRRREVKKTLKVLAGKKWNDLTQAERNRLIKAALQDLGLLDADGVVAGGGSEETQS